MMRAMARVARAMAMAKKRALARKMAMARAARAMATATRVAGNGEGDGNMTRVAGNCGPKIECIMLRCNISMTKYQKHLSTY
jgi:hypothetical protein